MQLGRKRMKLRVRGKREDVSLDVIWNEKADTLGRTQKHVTRWCLRKWLLLSTKARQGKSRGKDVLNGLYILYVPFFPFPWQSSSFKSLLPLSVSLQLLNSWSSGSLLIYPRKPHQISCPLMPWWLYHSCVPNPPEPCITCWSRVGSSFLAWHSMLWQSLL